MKSLVWYAYGLIAILLLSTGVAMLLHQRDMPGIFHGSLWAGVGAIWLMHFLSASRQS